MVLMNALHLYLRPGHELVRGFGGVHRFSSWPGAILTDSGGYQFFSLKGLYRIDDDGVEFQSPYDGSLHRFTPESVVDIQAALGSDIIMPLDHCPSGKASKKEVEEATDRTFQWLRRARDQFISCGNRNSCGNRTSCGSRDQALFGIIQGGVHLDFRKTYVTRSAELDLSGYAIGGVSVGEDRREGDEVVEEIASLLPENKPRYLMGVGLPEQILDGIASGIDMFDCVLPTRMARNGTLFTSTGRVNITNARYRDDPGPLDPSCSCPTCQRFSRAYLSHLYKVGDPGVLGLLSLHNLAYFKNLITAARSVIVNNHYSSWRREVARQWS
jgi:queuine tRNA-ribosyltransferase